MNQSNNTKISIGLKGFAMETQNLDGKESRKTLWTLCAVASVLMVLWKVLGVLFN